jgi:hypothetical protein
MIQSNDGGANVSFNGGRSWTEQDQPTAQFYRVALDNDFPYNVYGAQQDNSTVRIASRTTEGGITTSDWFDVGGGESGWIAPSPKDSNIVFAGSYGGLTTRYDRRTGQQRDINPYPNNPMGAGADVLKYRFQWNFPIVFSPHDPNTLYLGANVLFKSTDEGSSWQIISPDLTRNDKSRQGASGGPITKDNTSVEYYATIFTAMESPYLARQWQELVKRYSAREHDAGVDSDQFARSFPARSRHRLHRGNDVQVGRQSSVSLSHERLRENVEEDYQRYSRHGFHARHSRRSK